MKRLYQFYNQLKLQTKFTISHLVIATIPMVVLAAFFYTRLYDMIVSDTIRTEQNASAQTAPLIEELVGEVLNVHSQIMNMDFYRRTVSPARTESLDELALSVDAITFERQINGVIDGELITNVRIYMDIPVSETVFSVSTLSEIMFPMNYAYGTYWHGIFQGSSSTTALFCPTFYLGPDEVERCGDLAYITRSVMMYDGQLVPCYTAVYYSSEQLTQLLKNNLDSSSSVAYLINERDSMIATSDGRLSGAYLFDYNTVQESFMSSNNFILRHILGEDVYAGFYNISNSGWYMVAALPSQPLIEKSLLIVFGFLLMYAACIVIALFIATKLSHSITGRLSAVINQMAKARTGPPAALPASVTQDEIGDLIDTYNYMTTIINDLMLEQAQAAEDLRIAEFNSLQAQMNPHFLYNTMDMINWLSQQGRTREVTSAVQNLSRFYKLTLSRKEKMSTISDEIEHVSIYVQLQNMRFHNRIDFLVDIPDYLMDSPIPILTFQPVVENSILHGILEKESKAGTIVLTGWAEEDALVILISDDGVGIQEDKLEHILSGSGNSVKGTNIAIYNTHRRLQVLYGPSYGLSYSSIPGAGTDVQIRIPAN